MDFQAMEYNPNYQHLAPAEGFNMTEVEAVQKTAAPSAAAQRDAKNILWSDYDEDHQQNFMLKEENVKMRAEAKIAALRVAAFKTAGQNISRYDKVKLSKQNHLLEEENAKLQAEATKLQAEAAAAQAPTTGRAQAPVEVLDMNDIVALQERLAILLAVEDENAVIALAEAEAAVKAKAEAEAAAKAKAEAEAAAKAEDANIAAEIARISAAIAAFRVDQATKALAQAASASQAASAKTAEFDDSDTAAALGESADTLYQQNAKLKEENDALQAEVNELLARYNKP